MSLALHTHSVFAELMHPSHLICISRVQRVFRKSVSNPGLEMKHQSCISKPTVSLGLIQVQIVHRVIAAMLVSSSLSQNLAPWVDSVSLFRDVALELHFKANNEFGFNSCPKCSESLLHCQSPPACRRILHHGLMMFHCSENPCRIDVNLLKQCILKIFLPHLSS